MQQETAVSAHALLLSVVMQLPSSKCHDHARAPRTWKISCTSCLNAYASIASLCGLALIAGSYTLDMAAFLTVNRITDGTLHVSTIHCGDHT